MLNFPPWLQGLVEHLDLIPETIEFEIVRVPDQDKEKLGLREIRITINGVYEFEEEIESQETPPQDMSP